MSRDGGITLNWADGEHRFRLPIGQLRELQEKCAGGPPEILARLSGGRWKVDDVRETLRLGLIGGGMPPVEANILVTRYVDAPERPWIENVAPAQAVLLAALVGVPDEPLGTEKKTSDEATTTTPIDGGNSASSTGPESSWESPRARSIN